MERVGTEIRLQFPASPQFVRVARMTVSAVASAAPFDVEELEDLRIAVTELVNVLVDAGGAEVELRIALGDRGVEISGETAALVEPVVDPLTAQILGAIVDEYELKTLDGRAVFGFRKSAGAPA
jgi:hypothetical protein